MHSKKKVVDKFGQKFSQILPFMYGSYHESHGFGFKLNAYFCIIYMSLNECRINFSYIFYLKNLSRYSFGEFFNETFKRGQTALRRKLSSISFRDFIQETR